MRPRVAVLAFVLLALPGHAVAQTLTSTTLTRAVPAPTESQYDAAPPSNVTGSTNDPGGTGNVLLASTCINPNNEATACRVKIVGYGAGTPLVLQWMLVSAGAGGSCSAGAGVTVGTWYDITAGQTIQRTQGANTCTVTVAFRVKNLSYTSHQAPGPLSQAVNFSTCKPPAAGC